MAFLGALGGGLEIAGGVVAGAGSGGILGALGTFAVADGSSRVLLNVGQLALYLAEEDFLASALPTNGGALVGKIVIDGMLMGTPLGKKGYGELIGGFTNDFATFALTGAYGGAIGLASSGTRAKTALGVGLITTNSVGLYSTIDTVKNWKESRK
jgi:hypothetical protein